MAVPDHSTVERQRAHFDALADDYFAATQHPACLTFNQLIWKYFLTSHRDILPQDARVLEPMCGHGSAKEHLEQNLHSNFHYSGFDYSQQLVDIAQARWPGSHIFLQDITNFQPTQRYDVIFLSGGLHHVYAQTQDVLQRLRSALAPGGVMLSNEPVYDNALYGLIGRMMYRHSKKFDDASEQRYALSELNGRFCAAGFTIVDQAYHGLLAYMLSICAFCFPKITPGSPALIRTLVAMERPFYRTWLARKCSFSALTLLQPL